VSVLVAIGYKGKFAAEKVRLQLLKIQREHLTGVEDVVVVVKEREVEEFESTRGKLRKTSLRHEKAEQLHAAPDAITVSLSLGSESRTAQRLAEAAR
jgi:uncharacterized membrane protein